MFPHHITTYINSWFILSLSTSTSSSFIVFFEMNYCNAMWRRQLKQLISSGKSNNSNILSINCTTDISCWLKIVRFHFILLNDRMNFWYEFNLKQHDAVTEQWHFSKITSYDIVNSFNNSVFNCNRTFIHLGICIYETLNLE